MTQEIIEKSRGEINPDVWPACSHVIWVQIWQKVSIVFKEKEQKAILMDTETDSKSQFTHLTVYKQSIPVLGVRWTNETRGNKTCSPTVGSNNQCIQGLNQPKKGFLNMLCRKNTFLQWCQELTGSNNLGQMPSQVTLGTAFFSLENCRKWCARKPGGTPRSPTLDGGYCICLGNLNLCNIYQRAKSKGQTDIPI